MKLHSLRDERKYFRNETWRRLSNSSAFFFFFFLPTIENHQNRNSRRISLLHNSRRHCYANCETFNRYPKVLCAKEDHESPGINRDRRSWEIVWPNSFHPVHLVPASVSEFIQNLRRLVENAAIEIMWTSSRCFFFG